MATSVSAEQNLQETARMRLRRSIATAVAACALWGSAIAADISGPAIVVDGDSLRIDEHRIRLWGIDAPEGRQSCQREGVDWLCGQEAAKYLRELVYSVDVACQAKDTDRYGRTVAQCFLAEVDLAELMVGAGFALDYARYSGGFYAQAEDAARTAGRGLWAGEFIPPWEWRRHDRR